MRYAIYFTPHPHTALWAFGTQVIGYDSETGRDVPRFDHPPLRARHAAAWFEGPHRYGFHATLKAPFTLRDEATEAALLDAAASFAAAHAPARLSGLTVSELGDFIALVPENPPPALSELAVSAVQTFEPFRAPLSEADLQRRLAAPLTMRQRAHLQDWGYPYVLDEFRFHMTLSGRLQSTDRQPLLDALRSLYAPIAMPVTIDCISLCRQQSRDSNFRIVKRLALSG